MFSDYSLRSKLQSGQAESVSIKHCLKVD